jgi:outer membrane protein assembly factor BamB
MFKILAIIMLAAHFMGCKPTELPPELNIPDSPMVWKEKLERTGLTSTPHYYNGTVIFGHPSDQKNNYLVYCNNSMTGDSIWQTRIVTPFEFNLLIKEIQ